MIRTDRRLRLCAALVVGILTFIWGNSLLPAEISQALSDWVKALLFGPPTGASGGGGSGLLRKIAHFTEFCALGIALCWLFGMLRKKSYWPLLLGIGAACVDETIQCFVPNRGPGLTDIAIDTAGVAVGMILLLSGHNFIRKRKNILFWRKTNNEKADFPADGPDHCGHDGRLRPQQQRDHRAQRHHRSNRRN